MTTHRYIERTAHVHFVGIGGIGMSGIAEVLLNLGNTVSGSDLKESEMTRKLAALGARVVTGGHKAENLLDCDVVVVSSAVKKDNPEVLAARQKKIPVIPRAEMLAELMRLKFGVAIAGSHGKTTTTSMVATVFAAAGLDPTAVVGGKLNNLGSNAKLGRGEVMVVEADESDGSFLKLSPALCVITNIDPEHLDHYGTVENLKAAFADFANRVPFYGLAVMCLDHPEVQSILPLVGKRVATYGFSHQAEYRAENVRLNGFNTTFDAFRRGEPLGSFTLKMVGEHNAQNALACLAIADEMKIPIDVVRASLAEFNGVQRRFTVRGEVGGVTVVDDYGHHPAEVLATLKGARNAFHRRVVVAFQPHRYTRTHDLMNDFARAFNDADVLVLTDVYGAGEEPIVGATSDVLADQIRAYGHRDVTHVPARADVAKVLLNRIQPGDLVLTLGAGDISSVGPELVALLQAKSAQEKVH
jgi:UDP-N-acetylmuramate--alanine ligase